MKKIRRLAIANRGEVAVRIIRACQELGIESILLHSEADIQSRAYRLADQTVCLAGASLSDTYLNSEANIKAALIAKADAIHPGFGFLSENADFAEQVGRAGLLFVGPSPQAIKSLGDKVNCKKIANGLGIPLIPGYQGDEQDLATLTQQAEAIGYPVMVKAAAGGGGRGMKLLQNSLEAKELITSAQREAQSAFGSPKVFLEKYLNKAKHIEFQIFGDSKGNLVHLFDRECSVQRRHQKIIEEALSPSLSPKLREEMAETAKKIARAAAYQGAGTVEFLVQDQSFYFLEVNTRLQVEHPVTELILGVDLVKAQIETAQGSFSLRPQSNYRPSGHSIECRLYAENSYQGGIPSTGQLGYIKFPEGPGRRFDYGFEEGDTITPYYDPMIAKLIVFDETRERAIQKMIRVLDDTIVFGVQTNISYLKKILSHDEFQSGQMTTRMIENHFSDNLPEPNITELEKQIQLELIQSDHAQKEDQVLSPFNLGFK
jgi:acetyl/propionyl-CoA carboxylase alpha subunit